MKIFIIGGTTVDPKQQAKEFNDEIKVLQDTMPVLGQELTKKGHDILVCSPFEDSADFAIVNGIAPSETDSDSASVEFHYPESEFVKGKITALCERLGLTPRLCAYPAPPDLQASRETLRYAWLLAQLRALDKSHAVITVGGKTNESANLLLLLAEGRRHHVLPLTFLGGAAAQSFQRRRYQLSDSLGDDRLHMLADPKFIHEIPSLLESLVSEQPTRHEHRKAKHFFISYARSRPSEADFVEMTLRRRNYSVIRDEHDFGAGRSLPNEISEYIYSANVFVVLWCREYACSPWCFDELDLALKLKHEGKLTLWLIRLDDTRIVPPGARKLIDYQARTRKELEDLILRLLEQLESRNMKNNQQFD